MTGNATESGHVRPPDELLRAADVGRLMKVSTRTIWRLRDGCPEFPRPIRVSGNIIRWRRADIEAFVRSAQDA
jgi:predicted DNA-binding transcriptional regulator AlpA